MRPTITAELVGALLCVCATPLIYRIQAGRNWWQTIGAIERPVVGKRGS
jgi:hypothetical protein